MGIESAIWRSQKAHDAICEAAERIANTYCSEDDTYSLEVGRLTVAISGVVDRADLPRATADAPIDTPLCPVHQRLEDRSGLECEVGGNCVACSLNERAELLKILAPFAAKDGSEDSLTVMQRVVGFGALRDILEDANGLCRSAMAITKRRGMETNWEAFEGQLGDSLVRQHEAMIKIVATPRATGETVEQCLAELREMFKGKGTFAPYITAGFDPDQNWQPLYVIHWVTDGVGHWTEKAATLADCMAQVRAATRTEGEGEKC